MEPITAVTTTLSLAKSAGELGRKLFELGKSLKDREAQHQVDEIVDKLRDLKQSTAELENQNRDLKERLRFKSDSFEFHTPFWYEKAHPDRPLCAKCFAKETAAPMGEQGRECSPDYRRCLVCSSTVQVQPTVFRPSPRITSDFPSGR